MYISQLVCIAIAYSSVAGQLAGRTHEDRFSFFGFHRIPVFGLKRIPDRVKRVRVVVVFFFYMHGLKVYAASLSFLFIVSCLAQPPKSWRWSVVVTLVAVHLFFVRTSGHASGFYGRANIRIVRVSIGCTALRAIDRGTVHI